ncbi:MULTISPECIES: pyridoxal-phosphate dependent enzyme [unclassified Aureimonas]|uniref:pyridoxal-phosphate dependent enzyme n=1 Tax=unclassified Aureimonas TaxID=2615206 RepID=UPI0006F83740|nr:MULTISPECIES: pyridoxal-phosphate dependent enzyme [unclassified Aureimonas]KQT52104.1 cystathionine beta-synthase [Aureimonas sp. Leaf427]KQT70663.1 cystathionine beta-synthase [Aureimonas sp. Leaf460]
MTIQSVRPTAGKGRLRPPVRSVLDLVGETPMVELTKFDTGRCRLFLKLESHNPGGSIKDRIAVSMIEAAERSGVLPKGGTIVEATAGNTGLGLAQVGVPRGYRIILVVPDKMSREKVQHLRALGAEVHLARSDVGKGHPDYYQDRALAIAKRTPGALYLDQFSNPANPAAHEETTGPEIHQQLGGDVDAVVVGVGSGGTLTGLGRYFGAVLPKTEIILADPAGSVLAPYIRTGIVESAGSWTVEGIGEDFIPPNADLSLVTKAYTITDKQSMSATRDLLAREGILGGSSSGTLLAAALRYCREQTEPKRVVTFVCDSGNKYLSQVFDDVWLAEQGLAEREQHGDLRDVVARSHRDGAAIVASPDDSLLDAYGRMRRADVSQLPVLEEGRLVGLIDEGDLLAKVDGPREGRWERFAAPVRSAMSQKVHTLQASQTLESLMPVFDQNEVAIVLDGEEFIGLVTRIDLINHLRRNR